MPITKDQLQRLYVEQGLTYQEVADRLGYASTTPVETAMAKFDEIEPRQSGVAEPDAAWKDEETLRELYEDGGYTLAEIAERLECGEGTVHRNMKKMGIEMSKSKQFPTFETSHKGYERWIVDGTTFSVHRLSMIAEHGSEAVKGKVIHHRNEIPWDNRTENLEIMSETDHTNHHLNS